MGETIALVSCVSKKLDRKAKACELYTSPLFTKAFAYAKERTDRVFILSAEHGLVLPGTVLSPYDTTLNSMSKRRRERWAADVLEDLRNISDLENDEFIVLAGERYREGLLPHLKHHTIPMKGLGIGRQLEFLSRVQNCARLHRILRALPRHRFPFDAESIPRNGIYILFDDNEQSHGGARIVRVGTHTGENQLRSRLQQHFISENKDRSIFRKHVGRCLLNKDNDPFLTDWEIDLTPRKNRKKHRLRIDIEKQTAVEKQVTEYLRKKLSFCVLQVPSKKERLALEARLIATVSKCGGCKPGKHWLGKHSPSKSLRASGLWQVNHIKGTPMNTQELDSFQKRLEQHTLGEY